MLVATKLLFCRYYNACIYLLLRKVKTGWWKQWPSKKPCQRLLEKNSFEKPHHEENHPNNKLSCKISENNYVRLHTREHIRAYIRTHIILFRRSYTTNEWRFSLFYLTVWPFLAFRLTMLRFDLMHLVSRKATNNQRHTKNCRKCSVSLKSVNWVVGLRRCWILTARISKSEPDTIRNNLLVQAWLSMHGNKDKICWWDLWCRHRERLPASPLGSYLSRSLSRINVKALQ